MDGNSHDPELPNSRGTQPLQQQLQDCTQNNNHRHCNTATNPVTIITAVQGAAATTATTAPPSMNAITPSTNERQHSTSNDTNATTINAEHKKNGNTCWQ